MNKPTDILKSKEIREKYLTNIFIIVRESKEKKTIKIVDGCNWNVSSKPCDDRVGVIRWLHLFQSFTRVTVQLFILVRFFFILIQLRWEGYGDRLQLACKSFRKGEKYSEIRVVMVVVLTNEEDFDHQST